MKVYVIVSRISSIKGLFGLTYLSLPTGISTCETVWESLRKQLMPCA